MKKIVFLTIMTILGFAYQADAHELESSESVESVEFESDFLNNINLDRKKHPRCNQCLRGPRGPRGHRGLIGLTGPTGPAGIAPTFISARSSSQAGSLPGETLFFNNPSDVIDSGHGITYNPTTGGFTVSATGSYLIYYGFSGFLLKQDQFSIVLVNQSTGTPGSIIPSSEIVISLNNPGLLDLEIIAGQSGTLTLPLNAGDSISMQVGVAYAPPTGISNVVDLYISILQIGA